MSGAQEYSLVITHHADTDEADVNHVPSFLAAEYAVRAWRRFFDVTHAGIVAGRELQVVNLTANFGHELRTGPACFRVALQRVGGTSLQVAVDIGQEGRVAAGLKFTLVQVDLVASRARRLSVEQRDRLNSLPA